MLPAASGRRASVRRALASGGGGLGGGRELRSQPHDAGQGIGAAPQLGDGQPEAARGSLAIAALLHVGVEQRHERVTWRERVEAGGQALGLLEIPRRAATQRAFDRELTEAELERRVGVADARGGIEVARARVEALLGREHLLEHGAGRVLAGPERRGQTLALLDALWRRRIGLEPPREATPGLDPRRAEHRLRAGFDRAPSLLQAAGIELYEEPRAGIELRQIVGERLCAVELAPMQREPGGARLHERQVCAVLEQGAQVVLGLARAPERELELDAGDRGTCGHRPGIGGRRAFEAIERPPCASTLARLRLWRAAGGRLQAR